MRSYRHFALPTSHGMGRLLPFAALLAGVFVGWLAIPAAAQPAAQYRSDEIDSNAGSGQSAARGSVKDAARYAADKAKVDDYFAKYYFPLMTRNGPQDFEVLGKLRYGLFNDFLRPATHEAIQKDVTQAAYSYMAKVVTAKDPPYHPAVRYNAVLVLGMLDQQYGVETAGAQRPPQPLPDANKFLVQIVGAAADNKPVPPALVVGSLVGLQRHAQFRQSLPPEAVAAMSATVLKLATRDEPLPEADRETMAWIRLRAAEVLAQLGTVGQDGEVHNALLKLVSTSRSLDDRCAIAAQLAKIKYEGAKVDGKATADTILKLARDVAEAERTRATDFEEHRIGGAIGGSPSGGATRAGFDPFGVPEPFARRPLLAHITHLRTALQGVKPALPTDIQTKVDTIVKALAPVIEGAGNKDTGDLDLTGRVKAMADAIERAVPQESDAKEEMEAVLDVGAATEAAPAATDKPPAPAATPVPPAATEAPPAATPPATPEAPPTTTAN